MSMKRINMKLFFTLITEQKFFYINELNTIIRCTWIIIFRENICTYVE